MTRQEFLKSLWVRVCKPILIIGALSFLVRFFINALDVESAERQLINLIGFGFVIGGLLISIGFLLTYLSTLVVANTPDKVKKYLKANSRTIRIASYVILSALVLSFALKFVIEGEYGNLIGLVLVMAMTFLRQPFATRK